MVIGRGYFLKIVSPNISTTNQIEMNIKNRIFAMVAAPASMLVKPKIPAMIAIMRNMNDHLSIKFILG
jgi:hypothetical protein